MLIDNHLHLQDIAFNGDRSQSLERARQAGLTHGAINGTSPDDWPKVYELSQQQTNLIPCYGLHPWYVNTWKDRDWQSPLRKHLAQQPSAVGEIGLDRWIKDPDIDAQVTAFQFQITLANEFKRPAVIHCLRAWDCLRQELERFGPFTQGFMIHGYGVPAELIDPFIQLGAYLSFAGSVLDTKRSKTRKALKAVPKDRLLIETDAPDMPPPSLFRIEPQTTYQGRYRNEPANLPLILQGIADVLDMDVTVLKTQLETNARRFWRDLL